MREGKWKFVSEEVMKGEEGTRFPLSHKKIRITIYGKTRERQHPLESRSLAVAGPSKFLFPSSLILTSL